MKQTNRNLLLSFGSVILAGLTGAAVIARGPSDRQDDHERSSGGRGESSARCVLLAMPIGLEVRVLMDGSILRTERCERHDQAFALAARWCDRMMDRGWVHLRVTPTRAGG